MSPLLPPVQCPPEWRSQDSEKMPQRPQRHRRPPIPRRPGSATWPVAERVAAPRVGVEAATTDTWAVATSVAASRVTLRVALGPLGAAWVAPRKIRNMIYCTVGIQNAMSAHSLGLV